MDWTHFGLIAAGVTLGIVVAVLINVATQARPSVTVVIAIAVAGLGIAVVQYATNVDQKAHKDSPLAVGQSPSLPSPHPSKTPSHRPQHHSTSSPTAPGSTTALPTTSTSGPGQPQTPKPATPAPKLLDYTRLASVPAGMSSPNFCATVFVPSSNRGLLFFATKYGSFSTASFSVEGTAKRCTTYFAPDADSIRSDVITISVIDRKTNKIAKASETVPVPPDPTPPP